MGVPKFFRYISERYPCLSELVKETQIPEFDNLYLDMNGIIHNCSHPDDGNVQFRITEEQIFMDIFHYIDTLFRMIKPRKLFFMAVDGVAPRAKMNQQRGRRFRAAKDAETQIELAKKKGETLPDSDRFDSNCITPGTAFMVRLQNALKHFVQVKISTHPLWRKCKIILSGHETPGEGEHKIMEYIRYAKAQPAFDPNTRHCLYGLDADLVMLGLCSHELHFSLLREEVKFGSKAKKNTSVDNTRFYLLHLGLLREYLELEFISVKDKLTFEFDIEHLVDDWIFMCYLVGNDFIPNLPNFHINTNALPILYTTYMEVLPKLDGYINESGILNLKRLEVFLTALGEVDKNLFTGENANLDCLKGQNMNNDETFGSNMEPSAPNPDRDSDLMDLVQGTIEMFSDAGDDSDETDETEFYMHKRNYYIKKMGYAEMTPDVLAEQTECYVRALQWTLYYYYRGVRSWSWYYPHHYAPYISDVQNFSHLKLDYDIGQPFLPFQQLLAVLPAASKSHLPAAYHELMTCEDSKVIDYYPTNFETDLNGKKQDWEAVVLIPFIDENRLLSAMAEYEHKLSNTEVLRNIHGPMFQYEYDDTEQAGLDGQFGMSRIERLYCKETAIYRNELEVADDRLVLGPTPGVLRDVYIPGFPTMKHLEYTADIKCIRIKVFDMASRNESVVVRVLNRATNDGDGDHDLAAIGAELLDKEVFVCWPHLSEAKVVALIDHQQEFNAKGLHDIDSRIFKMEFQSLRTHYTSRMGIEVGDTPVLVGVLPLLNHRYTIGNQGIMTLDKEWSDNRVWYPLQTVVRDLRVNDSEFVKFTRVEDIFTKDSPVFMISTIYYGSLGVVVDPTLVKQCGRIKISLTVKPEPDFSEAKRIQALTFDRYEGAFNAALAMGIASNVFSMITGSFLVVLGEKRFPLPDGTPKVNIGLQLKFPKKNEEVVGFTKKQNNQFMYSKAAIELVELYYRTWPRVFEYLSSNTSNELCFETNLFDESGQLDAVSKWLKQQPHSTAERRSCGTVALETDTLQAIVLAVAELRKLPRKTIKLQVKPHLVYKPGLNHNSIIPDAAADFDLFDRVVVAKDSHSVPLGFKGTIISKHSMHDPNPIRHENLRKSDVFFDVLFDHPFDDGSSIIGVAEKRVFKVSKLHLINISYGLDKFKSGNDSIEKSDAGTEKATEPETNAWMATAAAANVLAAATPKPKHVAQTKDDATSNDIWQMLKQKPNDEIRAEVAATTTTETAATTNVDSSNESQSVIAKQSFQAMLETMKVAPPPAVLPFPVLPMPPLIHEQFRKINVNDMFNVDTNNLPQPPPNWRNKMVPPPVGIAECTSEPASVAPPPSSSSSSIATNPMPTGQARPIKGAGKQNKGDNLYYSNSGGSVTAPSRPNDGIYHPQPMNMYPPMMSRQQQGPPPMQQTKIFHQGPNGPQNLSHNSKYLPGQGAFIPLQATRKINTNHSKAKQSFPQSIAQQVVQNNHPTKVNEPVVAGNSSTDQSDKKNFVHPQPRPSRIAARFDLVKN